MHAAVFHSYVGHCLGMMADSGASTSCQNPSSKISSSRSEARKQYETKRDASRVVLVDAFEKWREFREEHGLKTDQNVAEFLLNFYAARNTFR